MSSDQYPSELHSAKFGTLQLREVRALEFKAFHYHAIWRDPQHEALRIVFHPPKNDFKRWQKSLAEAEDRAVDLLTNERAVLQTGNEHFKRLFKDYKIGPTRIDAILPDLKLSILKLVSDEDDELVYAPCKWFSSLDLNVSIDRDYRVTEAHFGG